MKLIDIEALAELFSMEANPSYDMIRAKFIQEMINDGHFPSTVYHTNGDYYMEEFITPREKQDMEFQIHGAF
jgi:hypothetical protein